MATYFHGSSEIQGDGSQTLVLMNHGYVNGYTDHHQQHHHHHHHHSGSLVFLNSTTGTGGSLQPPSPNSQQFVGVPLLPTTASAASSSFHADGGDGCPPLHLQDFVPRVEYNVWNPVDPTTAMASAGGVQRPRQGLSLSLSPQQTAYGSYRGARDVTLPGPPTANGGERIGVLGISSATSTISTGLPGLHGVMLSSKYLKSAQQLLNEVVSVGDGLRMVTLKERTMGDPPGASAAGEEEDTLGKRDVELTTAERQEIHLKKAKLLGMLEEVEQRYRQYDHQMQMVISAFEQVAGDGSAKAYTTLALQTISKQFRSLKDVIIGQIRIANRCLGEEDLNKTEVSRLKFVDHHLRQQRALQQLGMIPHNAWRPQRGLPERSVSILRAWLFEHFLHPYPKDSDKLMLAKQTGLTRSQVSNWFINARVRLWKPMVEEMYLEEIKAHEQKQSEEQTTGKMNQIEEAGRKMIMYNNDRRNPIPENQSNEEFISTTQQDNSSTGGGHPTNNNNNNNNNNSISTASTSQASQSGFTQGSSPPTLKKPRCGETTLLSVPTMEMEEEVNPQQQSGDCGEEMISFRFGEDRHGRDGGYTFMSTPANFIGGFGSYTIGDIGRFHAEPFPTGFSGNAVSLTLGLPHCEGLSLSEAHHRSFLPDQGMELGRTVEMGSSGGYNGGGGSGHSASLEDISRMPGRKQFVAAQLLPDFVS